MKTKLTILFPTLLLFAARCASLTQGAENANSTAPSILTVAIKRARDIALMPYTADG